MSTELESGAGRLVWCISCRQRVKRFRRSDGRLVTACCGLPWWAETAFCAVAAVEGFRLCSPWSSHNPDVHHIVTRGSGGRDTKVNRMLLCRYHHQEYHQVGSREFARLHPGTLEAINDALREHGLWLVPEQG